MKNKQEKKKQKETGTLDEKVKPIRREIARHLYSQEAHNRANEEGHQRKDEYKKAINKLRYTLSCMKEADSTEEDE